MVILGQRVCVCVCACMLAGGMFVQINVGQDLAFMLHFIYGGCQ